MKNIKYLNIIGLAMLTLLFACDPMEELNPEAGLVLPPDESEMEFSITPGDDDYHFNIELVSPVLSGINTVSFDLGNGSVVKEKSAVAYYSLPDDYTITMTIKTNGGSTSITKELTTTETDYSIFTDEKFVALTGGADDMDGKTWVVDAETKGHFGVGSTGSDGLEWWSADPFTKEGTGAYDDELNFKLNGFAVTYDNNGISYVKGYVKDDPDFSNLYLNPRENKEDWDVDYQTPVSGTWSITEKDGKNYLIINSDNPIFPGLDVGALNNEYEIVNISENYIELTCFSAYENWTKWHFILRNKEYEKPKVNFDVSLDSGSDTNEYEVNISNVEIPVGQSIDKVVVDFGDGTIKETMDYMETVSNVYMRKGVYETNVTVTTSVESTEISFTTTVTDNHPDYEEFLLDEMVMYNDFSEVQMASVNGQDCFVAVDDNPNKIYPNKSSKVGFMSKTNNAWSNANLELPKGYRFNLSLVSTFKMMVYGKAGDIVLLKLENTDKAEGYKTGTHDVTYEIKQDNTWEVAEFNLQGVGAGWDGNGDIFTNDVTTDPNFNQNFYNVIRIMLNPGVWDGTHEFYFDELAGPHVEGIKSARIK